jgi:beta-glucosidase
MDKHEKLRRSDDLNAREPRLLSRRGVLQGASVATLASVAPLPSARLLGVAAEAGDVPRKARQSSRRDLEIQEPQDPRVEALLARMTLADKIGQLNIPLVLPWVFLLASNSGSPVGSLGHQERFVKGKWLNYLGPGGGLFSLPNQTLFGLIPVSKPRSPAEQAELSNHLQQLAHDTPLGIPLLQIGEGTHGAVAPGATIFPEGPALAASWNPQLIEAVYTVTAKEARAVGLHALNTVLAEVIRDPRFGRGCQGFGEDPCLVGAIVKALVRGLQGSDVSSPERVAASLCHYPIQTPNVGGLEGSSVEIGEREFREVHLPAWRAGFAEAGALMTEACASTIDGEVTHGSEYILTEILRGELGFRGVVISEGDGFSTLVKEHIVATQKEAGALAIRAGVDVSITWESAYLDGLWSSIKDGSAPMELLDRAVRRVLALKFKLGLFDNPFVDPKRAAQVVNSPEHRAVALQAAREAIVLLKNDGELLPLGPKIKRIAVIGPNAHEPENLLGDYKAYPPMHTIPSILDAIRAKAPQGVAVTYERGCEVIGDDRKNFPAAINAAHNADVAVVVVGEQTKGGFGHPNTTNGEGRDVASLDLTGVQQALVEAVHATRTPTVVVLINGRALSIRWIAAQVPAILDAWFPGERGGEAITEVLFGHYNPSGRLPVTFPRHVGQLPMFYNQKHARAEASDYVDMPANALYEFGFGLSYTQFRYADLRISPERITETGSVDVSVQIKNVGKRAGQEVVQLYVMDVISSVSLPAKQLRGFNKVQLEAGETKTVHFTLTRRDLELVNMDVETVVEPGEFEVMVGSSSAKIHLRGRFQVVPG